MGNPTLRERDREHSTTSVEADTATGSGHRDLGPAAQKHIDRLYKVAAATEDVKATVAARLENRQRLTHDEIAQLLQRGRRGRRQSRRSHGRCACAGRTGR
jgi:hypothetical protein